MGCMDSGKSKSTSTSYIPAQKKGLETLISSYLPELFGGDVMTGYGGDRVAEFTPTQKAALGGTEGLLDKFSPDAPYPMFGETGDALKGILGGQTGAQKITPEQTSSFFKSAYQDPAQYQFSEYTRPLIREEYSGPGFWGSARAGAVSKAGQELGNWLGQKRGEVEWQAGETNRAIDEAKAGRALSAVPLGLDYAGAPTREAQARLAGRQGVFGFAGQEQQQQQRRIQESITKYREGKLLTDPEILEIFMALIGQSMGSSTTQGQGMLGSLSSLGNAAAGMGAAASGIGSLIGGGGGSAAAGAGAGINYMAAFPFSDIRLKENIETIDNALEKVMALDGKTFKFKKVDGQEAGLIAQDLEKVLPESVIEDGNGMKAVKYPAVIALLVNAVKELAQRGQNGK